MASEDPSPQKDLESGPDAEIKNAVMPGGLQEHLHLLARRVISRLGSAYSRSVTRRLTPSSVPADS